MKTVTLTTSGLVKVSALIAMAFLASCGTSKATNTTNTTTTDLSSVVDVAASVPLASCNQLSKPNFLTMNIANLTGSNGQVSAQYVKLRFLNVSSALTPSGYNLRFYKWRVINNKTQLDSTPLQVYSYSLDTLQATSTVASGIYASQISDQKGYMVNLRDDSNNQYQVIKVVAYKSDGVMIDQANVLIPQFLASPLDYKLNPDGSTRVDLLRDLHPLNSTDVSGWSATQIQDSFEQYCF